MQTYDKQSVADLLLVDVLADWHRAKRKLAFFCSKYACDLQQFETGIESDEESFERFDDLIEWKAYQAQHDALAQKIEELKHGRFQVA